MNEKFKREEDKNKNWLATKFGNFRMIDLKSISLQLQMYLHMRT